MKLIFGFLLFVATVAVTGGIYLIIRKPEQKKTDLKKLLGLPSKIAQRLQRLGDYLVARFGSKLESATDQPTAESSAPAA